MTQAELDAIKARCEAATPGEWRWETPDGYCPPSLEDRELLVHAREDICRLVAEVERLAQLEKDVFQILEGVGLDERIREEVAALEAERKEVGE